jgi:hypothetical protein
MSTAGITILIIIILSGLVLYALWKHACHKSMKNNIEMYQARDHVAQIDTMDALGDRILSGINFKMVDEIPDPIPAINYPRNLEPSNPVKPPLHPALSTLVDDVTRVMVGKYTLDNLGAISHVKKSLDKVVRYLSQSKDNDTILNEYDPKYSNDLLLEACRDLFEYNGIEPMKKLLIGQYIVNKSLDGDEVETVYNYIVDVALNRQISSVIRQNAADILSLSNSTKYKKIVKQSLELLRREDDVALRQPRAPGGGQQTLHIARHQPVPIRIGQPRRQEHGERNDLFIIPPLILDDFHPGGARIPDQIRLNTDRTIYTDNQNVHNTEVNNSVLEAAKELVANYNPPNLLSFDYTLIKDLPDTQKTKIESSLHRITTDPSIFKHGTTLFSIFQSLLNFISQHEHKDELNKRLVDELTDMSGLCATGCMARLINVMQGFEMKPELKIKVKMDDEVYAKIKHIIDTAMQEDENMDQLIDDMTSPDKLMFNDFSKRTIRANLEDLNKEYKDIESTDAIADNITKALNKYTKTDHSTAFWLTD